MWHIFNKKLLNFNCIKIKLNTKLIKLNYLIILLIVWNCINIIQSAPTNNNHLNSLPIVDKGVFVITGVHTCGQNGTGYCILGNDCTVDNEFQLNNVVGQHCNGLRTAFTPRAFFSCCEFIGNNNKGNGDLQGNFGNQTQNSVVTTGAPINDTILTATAASTAPVKVNLLTQSNSNEELTNSNSNSVEEDQNSVEDNSFDTTTIIYTQQTEISLKEEFSLQELLSGKSCVKKVVRSKGHIISSKGQDTSLEKFRPLRIATNNDGNQQQTGNYYYYSEVPVAEVPVNEEGQDSNQSRDDNLNQLRSDSTCWTAAITRINPITTNENPSDVQLRSDQSKSTQSTSIDPGSYICTGSILTSNLILTTATCATRITKLDLGQYQAVLNSKHLVHINNGRTADGIKRNIKDVIVHETYKVLSGGGRLNDIALIVLEDGQVQDHGVGLGYNEDGYYCNICLGEKDGGRKEQSGNVSLDGTFQSDSADVECIVTGYSHPSDTSPSDGFLHTAAQSILSCTELNCTVYSPVNTEACFSPRDAGSPLACRLKGSNSDYQLYGLFSSGFHCGSRSVPVYYTNALSDTYMRWLEEKILLLGI